LLLVFVFLGTHNLKAARSNRAPATKLFNKIQ